MIELALSVISLTGPDEQSITIVPGNIVSMREPRSTEHFARGIKCLINTVDGKFTAVVETCDVVRERMGE